MPAFRAEATIAAAVRSVLDQSHEGWRLYVVSDDGTDYDHVLGRAGLRDRRFRFLATAAPGSGASAARNVALDALDTDHAALLDADDRFKPAKLARCLAALDRHALVSTAIDVVDQAFRHLRHVGVGADRELTAGRHKFVNLSMDSMIVWDRRRTDARCDPGLPNMNDLDLLIRLFARAPRSFHIGVPLHEYVKVPASLSNAAPASARMVGAKTTILARLTSGYYGLDAEAVEGLVRFLEISLAAERAFPEASAKTPGLLFEDHLEPRLRATSPA